MWFAYQPHVGVAYPFQDRSNSTMQIILWQPNQRLLVIVYVWEDVLPLIQEEDEDFPSAFHSI